MRYFLASVIFMLSLGSAQAKWNDDATKCAAPDLSGDEQIKHCTKALSSRELDSANKAVTLANRGAAWFMKHDLPHAMEDYSAAVKIDNKLASALLGRGQVNFVQGRYDFAAQDLMQAERLAPGPYVTIWLFLAQLRAGKGDRSEMLGNAKELNGDVWPTPVVHWYTGKLKTAAALEKARDSDPKVERAQKCEAHFYIGEWQLAKGFNKYATEHLKEAVAICPRSFVEYVAASAEVKRLK